MSLSKFALAFVGFAAFLHVAHVVCATIIVQRWSRIGADEIATAYGIVDPLLALPKYGCLAMGGALFLPALWRTYRAWMDAESGPLPPSVPQAGTGEPL